MSVFFFLRSDCTDALKTSLAAALRHSPEQAQRTYDRRTANQKKQMAVTFTRQYAESELEDGMQPGCSPVDDAPLLVEECAFKPGDFVATVEDGSSLNAPKILLGQVQALPGPGDDGKVLLLWYKAISPNLYKLKLDGQHWRESIVRLTSVVVKAAKNRPGVYRLTTSLRRIHKAVTAEG